MSTYKGIKFAEGLNVPFAKFKEMFGGLQIFKDIPHKQLEAELEKAYKIAVPNGNVKPTKKENTETQERESK